MKVGEVNVDKYIIGSLERSDLSGDRIIPVYYNASGWYHL